jgi:hypothetical protein
VERGAGHGDRREHRQAAVRRGSSGGYTLWLNRAYNPLQIIAATLGYAPAAKVADLVKGTPVTVNFALSEIP